MFPLAYAVTSKFCSSVCFCSASSIRLFTNVSGLEICSDLRVRDSQGLSSVMAAEVVLRRISGRQKCPVS